MTVDENGVVSANGIRQTSADAWDGGGYVSLSNGLKIQWGTYWKTGAGSVGISYPIPFTTTPSAAIAIGSWSDEPSNVIAVSTTNFTVQSHGDTTYGFNLKWIAVGV